ncbi:MAG: hypothetical protein NC926_09575, partial [Candidatus Omnitrophica bacterium]|nr:hypothetical protein [Candidatus Omnitrophota bacterium]
GKRRMPGIEITDNYIRYRVRNPEEFKKESFRTIDFSKDKGIKAIIGIPKDGEKTEVQAILFDKDKWTEKEVKKWLKEHDYKDLLANVEDEADDGTVEIKNKEIFAAGVWNGDKYTVEDLDNIVKAFYELKGRRDVPLKLGHDEKQELLQRDGYPAAGWLVELRREGKKLIGDFAKVPKKIAELIEKGAYRRVSAEIIWNYRDNETGKVYPKVLSAVALLGADIPAVSSISAWSSLYHDELLQENIHFYTIDFEKEDKYMIEELKKELEEIKKKYEELRNFFLEIANEDEKKEDLFIEELRGKTKEYEVWSRAFINDLPDAAFAVILPGGEKDEEGKTTPRSLRKLPHHNKNVKNPNEHDSVDLPHLRNALARLPQTDIPEKYRKIAEEHLWKHAKALGVGEAAKEEEKKHTEQIIQKEEDKNMDNEIIKQLQEENEKLKRQLKEQKVKAYIEKLKQEGKVLPKMEKYVFEDLMSADDSQLKKYTEDDGQEVEMTDFDKKIKFYSQLPKLVEFEEKVYNEQKKDEIEISRSVENIPVDEKQKKAYSLMEKLVLEKNLSFEKAYDIVRKEHPELFK